MFQIGQHLLQTCSDQITAVFRQFTNKKFKHRLLIHALRPPILEQVGLAEAIRLRLSGVEERVGLKTTLTVESVGDLAPVLEAELYSMAQEALNNALKHAHATQVNVRLACEDEVVVMEIGDDGQGFDVQQALSRGGLGLTSLHERVGKLGGALEVLSEAGGGSQIRVRVPRGRSSHARR